MESINKITFIAILSLSINLFSQEIDAKFIESIPENIRKDLIQSYQNKQDGADAPSSKEYNSFQSIVEANNDIDSYRNLERFGNSFFSKYSNYFYAN
jgi:hypothetical protein